LFQNRYKDIICEDEPYFLELVRYIHLNPVRAGIIRMPEELGVYPWTGHGTLMGLSSNPWQTTTSVLERFGQTLKTARIQYRNFILDGWTGKEDERFEGGGLIRSMGGMAATLTAQREGQRQAYDQRVLGSGDFVEGVLHRAEAQESERRRMHSMSIETVQVFIARKLGIQPSELQEKGRSRQTSRGKAMLLYVGVHWLGRRLKELEKIVKISSGTASRALRRGKQWAEDSGLITDLKGQLGRNVP
jgi:hypothetical protein